MILSLNQTQGWFIEPGQCAAEPSGGKGLI